MRKISNRLVHGVGFSNGCAEFALKNPPPFVPSSLIASCDATGPPGTVAVPPVIVATSWKPERFWMTPPAIRTTAATIENGSSTRRMPRVRSTQKLPIVPLLRRGEAADQGDGDGDADGGRDEVLHGEPDELHRVAERDVGGVRLPVRVGHERDRGVEGEVLARRGQAERVRQPLLQALQRVDEQDADGAESQHRAEVGGPALRARRHPHR